MTDTVAEIQAAVAGRDGWTMDGDTARYRDDPDDPRVATLTPTPGSGRADRPFFAAVAGRDGGTATGYPHRTAGDAVLTVEECYTVWPAIYTVPLGR